MWSVAQECTNCSRAIEFMKRSVVVVETSVISKRAKSDQITDIVSGDRTPGMTGVPGASETEKSKMDEDPPNSSIYNCLTSNRFEILWIPRAAPTVLRAPKLDNPPPLIVYESAKKIREILPANQKYGIQNTNGGTKVLCNSSSQHKLFLDVLDNKNVSYHTYPYAADKKKRFVLYGLNTHPVEDIANDLEAYGIKPAHITNMIVKKQRPFHVFGVLP